jgi:hypothetical protein
MLWRFFGQLESLSVARKICAATRGLSAKYQKLSTY